MAPDLLTIDPGARRAILDAVGSLQPGAIALLAQALGARGISIASVIQHDPGDDAPDHSPVPLVIMTHLAVQADLHAALKVIDNLEVVHAPSICLGVED